MSPVLLALVAILVSLIGYLVHLSRKANAFFDERGIPQLRPSLFFGHVFDLVFSRTRAEEVILRPCRQFPDAPLVGYVSFLMPNLIVKDPSWAEKVLIKDFTHFSSRGFEMEDSLEPVNINLFNMTGQKWKVIRNKLSPIFTSGKLKNMFNNMSNVGSDLTKAIRNEKMECTELREVMGRYAVDTLGLYAFGLDPRSLENPDSEFRQKGKSITTLSGLQFIKFLINTFCPTLTKLLGVTFIRSDIQKYFIDIIRQTIDKRVANKEVRNDFVDLMLQLKEKGHVEVQTKDPNDDYLRIDEIDKTETIELTDELLIGQAFIFLVAGFDGIASTMTFFSYEMAKNPDIQEKLRREMVQVAKKHGKVNFEAIKDMTYLDMCLKESMRKWPPSLGTMRICTKDYSFPNGYTIRKGEALMVPTLHIHRNPEIYPDPMVFDPERFAPGHSIAPCTYLPFGEGPRMCIAMRFAILQVKFGLVKIFSEFKVELNAKTVEPLEFNPKALLTSTKKPVYFDLTEV